MPSPATQRRPTRAAAPETLTDVLAHTTFVVMGSLTKLAADNDLSLTQLRVLAILRDRQVRMSALATHLGLDRSTLSGLVDRAEKRDLLTRAPNAADRRSVDVLLTAAGRALAVQLQASVADSLAGLTDNLTPGERSRLQMLLTRMLGAAGE